MGWNQNGLRTPEEHLPSTTEVLSVPRELSMDFEIERVRGSWSPHIPEKKPRYWITWGTWNGSRHAVRRRAPGIEVEPVRLGQLGTLNAFIVLRPVHRVQRCLVHKGLRHALIKGSALSLKTFCGESPYLNRDDETRAFVPGTPDCKECLARADAKGQGWVFYYAYPFEDKRVDQKDNRKAKTLAKRKEKLPTAFDRLLLDDPLNPPPKPPKKRMIHPPQDLEEDFEGTHREEKLQARRQSAEHFKQAKKRVHHD